MAAVQQNSLGQKIRGWLRFAHTGELGGLPGQLIAGIGCFGGVFLVYTGLSLAVRRLWNWSLWTRFGAAKRRPSRAEVTGPAPSREAASWSYPSDPREATGPGSKAL